MACFKRFFIKQQGSFNLDSHAKYTPTATRYQAPQYILNLEGPTIDETTTDRNERTESGISSLVDFSEERQQQQQQQHNAIALKKKKDAPKTPQPPPSRKPPTVPERSSSTSEFSSDQTSASKKFVDNHVSVIKVNQSPVSQRKSLRQTSPKGILRQEPVVEDHVSIIRVVEPISNERLQSAMRQSPPIVNEMKITLQFAESTSESKKSGGSKKLMISDSESDDSEIKTVERPKPEKRQKERQKAKEPEPIEKTPELSKPVEKKRKESVKKVSNKIEELTAPPTIKNARKRGIISEKPDQSEAKELKIDTYEKDYPSQELIKRAITANDFLNNMMDVDRLDAVTQAMTPCTMEAYSYIITEGESGSYFYVSAEGTFEVLKEGKVIKSFNEGVVFGELAILYKAKRFASIRITTPGKVWRLERRVFQKIMMQSGRKEREENIRFLSSVSVLKDVPLPILSQISDILKREFHATGATIIQQGDPGDKFYIIRGGSVNVLKTDPTGLEKLVGTLHRGAYFGEQALLYQDRRLASIIANPPGTECLTLDRLAFVNLLGGIEMIRDSKPVDNFEPPKYNSLEKNKKYEHMQLHDLSIVGTLGVGGYGRVELVQYKKSKQTFALKYLKKIDMVQQQRQEHAYSEKDIMLSCDSDFIARLYKTYRDKKYLYFLMEACLGGDVWTVLQKKKFFDEKTSKFMTACVVEAFDYMHSRNMIYRDLKPENLMLDEKGYIKLVDFGFAKRVGPSQKTWTFAGTPEYVSPEIILNKGHDRAVDYWALGVFIHELLIGKPPFRGKDHMKTYNLILRGIDVIQMPQKIPKKVQTLIKRLCRQSPVERLGYQKNGIADIKNNPWFNGFDWVKLQECTMPAPLVRPVKNNTDLSNFDEYPRDRDEPAEENSGWDFDF